MPLPYLKPSMDWSCYTEISCKLSAKPPKPDAAVVPVASPGHDLKLLSFVPILEAKVSLLEHANLIVCLRAFVLAVPSH